MSCFCSIIVPVYNVEFELENCLQSIDNQTNKDFEVIIINDGSTDNSLRLAERFIHDKPNFKIVTQKNIGLGGARNTGLVLAGGEFVWFVDSDDQVYPHAIEKLKENVSSELDSIIFSYTNYLVGVDKKVTTSGVLQGYSKDFKEGEYSGMKALTHFFDRNIYSSAWNKVYRRTYLLEQNLLFTPTAYFEDLGFTPRALANCRQVKFVEEDLYKYYRREGSITLSCNTKHAFSIFIVLDEVYDFLISNTLVSAYKDKFLDLFWDQVTLNYKLRKEGFTTEMELTFLNRLKISLSKTEFKLSDLSNYSLYNYISLQQFFQDKLESNICLDDQFRSTFGVSITNNLFFAEKLKELFILERENKQQLKKIIQKESQLSNYKEWLTEKNNQLEERNVFLQKQYYVIPPKVRAIMKLIFGKNNK